MHKFYLYKYHFIDDSRFIRPAQIVLTEDGLSQSKIDSQINIIKKLFKKEGWEGDGELGIIWLPPFLDISSSKPLKSF